jgi:hypothetical protein
MLNPTFISGPDSGTPQTLHFHRNPRFHPNQLCVTLHEYTPQAIVGLPSAK